MAQLRYHDKYFEHLSLKKMTRGRRKQNDAQVIVRQQRRGWRVTNASRGSSRNYLLALVLVIASTIIQETYADNAAIKNDDAISECQRIRTAVREPQKGIKFWTGGEGENFMEMVSTSPAGWKLTSILSLHPLDQVDEDTTTTVMCVGLVDTTSYTNLQDRKAKAWVTFHTKRQIPIGLVRVDSRCWLSTKHFGACSPSFMPVSYIVNLPLYNYSPLEENFWTNMTIEALEVNPNWIWRINTNNYNDSIKAEWIYNMDIPSLESLEILRNNWKRPKNILKAMPKLKELNLSYNNLEVVPQEMLLNMTALQRLNLGHNNISEYPKSISQLTKLILLDLTNPIGNATLKIPDEDIVQLPESLHTLGLENTKLEANVSHIILLPKLTFLNLSGCSLGNINDHHSKIFKSELEIIDLSKNNLQYLPQNIFMEMPKLKWLILSNNKLEQLPNEILVENALTNLYLDHNRISNITSDPFKNLKKLKLLDLSWNGIKYLLDSVFESLRSLTYVDISHNKLTSVPNMLFSYTPNILEIHLSHNLITEDLNLWKLKIKKLDLSFNDLKSFHNNMSSIEDCNLSHNDINNLNITSITKLNISFNSMRFISPEHWKMFTQLKDVDLGGNDFECCLFGNRTFLKEPYTTKIWNLGSSDALTCSLKQTSIQVLLETFVYNETECSPLEEIEFSAPIGITVVLPVTVLILTGTIIVVMMYVYRFELTYVSHLFRMKKIGAETDEQRYKTCVYDAFVCYSAKNFEWVTGILLPGLEDGPEGYRLCLHDRDFALGAGINRNIVASLEKSRKVIFALSNDFIASKWCQWELEMANHKMFEEKRNYIILVELERLPRKTLPRHLRYLMDRTTYLEWPEEGQGTRAHVHKAQQGCFRRLREALGDSLRQRTGRDNEGFFTVLDAP